MQHQQLGNCNLIEMGPFVRVQSWERWTSNCRLCYTAQLAGGGEGKSHPNPLCSSHHCIIWLPWFIEKIGPSPWRPQEFRNQFCSWLQAKPSSSHTTRVCVKCRNCSEISSWPGECCSHLLTSSAPLQLFTPAAFHPCSCLLPLLPKIWLCTFLKNLALLKFASGFQEKMHQLRVLLYWSPATILALNHRVVPRGDHWNSRITAWAEWLHMSLGILANPALSTGIGSETPIMCSEHLWRESYIGFKKIWMCK